LNIDDTWASRLTFEGIEYVATEEEEAVFALHLAVTGVYSGIGQSATVLVGIVHLVKFDV